MCIMKRVKKKSLILFWQHYFIKKIKDFFLIMKQTSTLMFINDFYHYIYNRILRNDKKSLIFILFS